MILQRTILCVFFLICLSTLGYSIKCYKCHSDIKPNCGEGVFDSSGIEQEDCAARLITGVQQGLVVIPTHCSKVTRSDGGRKVTSRGCFQLNPRDPSTLLKTPDNSDKCMKWQQGGGGNYQNCELCDSELCNGATSKYATVGLTLLLVALGVFAF